MARGEVSLTLRDRGLSPVLGLSAAPAQPLTALISCAGHMVNLEKPEQFARATLDSPGQLPMW